MNLPITIFHTNDMHGRLEAISRLSHFARRQREAAEAAGRTVFFWDAGDAADRRIRICSLTKGAAFGPLLTAMGITLQTVGNAISLTYGPQALAGMAERMSQPLLAANLRDAGGRLIPGVQARTLVPLPQGPPLGIFGLTAPWGTMYEDFGLKLPDSFSTARAEVKKLKAAGAGMVIFLSHLGLSDDRKIAKRVPGIDLIIGSHSHDHLPEGEWAGDTLIVQAGDYAQYLGEVTCELAGATGRPISCEARTLPVPAEEPLDPAFEAALARVEVEMIAIEGQILGEILVPLDLDHYRECGIGNFAADALKDRWQADLAILSGGLFHAPLPAGKLTFGILDRACFSTANPYLTVVRGRQLSAALERGLDPKIYELKPGGFRGTPVGIPQISGMSVTCDMSAPVGERVKDVEIGGKPLKPQDVYRVAHTDAEVHPEIGYLKLEKGQATEHEVPTILREALADYLQDRSPLPEPQRGRWKQL